MMDNGEEFPPMQSTTRWTRKTLWNRSRWCLTLLVGLVPFALVARYGIRMKSSYEAIGSTEMPGSREYYVPRFMHYREEVVKFSPVRTLLDPESPQARALEWLAFRDDTLPPDAFGIDLAPRYALLVLFYSCGGETWGGIEYSLQKSVTERSAIATCEWTDLVGCDSNGRITSLKSSGFGLFGQLPDEMALLTDLTSIRMPTNMLKGTIPDALFHELSNLGKKTFMMKCCRRVLTANSHMGRDT